MRRYRTWGEIKNKRFTRQQLTELDRKIGRKVKMFTFGQKLKFGILWLFSAAAGLGMIYLAVRIIKWAWEG